MKKILPRPRPAPSLPGRGGSFFTTLWSICHTRTVRTSHGQPAHGVSVRSLLRPSATSQRRISSQAAMMTEVFRFPYDGSMGARERVCSVTSMNLLTLFTEWNWTSVCQDDKQERESHVRVCRKSTRREWVGREIFSFRALRTLGWVTDDDYWLMFIFSHTRVNERAKGLLRFSTTWETADWREGDSQLFPVRTNQNDRIFSLVLV